MIKKLITLILSRLVSSWLLMTLLCLANDSFAQDIAQPNVCYASTGRSGGGALLTIDPSTAAVTLRGATGLKAVPGLAIDSSGALYGLNQLTGELYFLDPDSGGATFALSTGLSGLENVTFDENNLLYGLRSTRTPYGDTIKRMYRIEVETGATTLIGTLPSFVEGLAVDPADGRVWGSGRGHTNGDGALFVIDPGNAGTTLIGTTGVNGAITDIHFDSEGQLYGMTSGTGEENKLIAIDKGTGQGKVIGTVGLRDVRALAFARQKVDGPLLGVSTQFLNFETVSVDSSKRRTVTLSSLGRQPLTISAVAVSPSVFSTDILSMLPFALQPGQSISFEVVFRPTAQQEVRGGLTIASNSAIQPAKLIELSGKSQNLRPVQPNTLYAVTGRVKNRQGSLITIDHATGAGTFLGTTAFETVSALAISPTGILHVFSGKPAGIYLVDALTGSAFLSAYSRLSKVDGAAFDNNGRLLITSGDTLYIVNQGTGETTPFARVPYGSEGIAVDPTDGTVWITGIHSDAIHALDPQTGKITEIGSTGLSERTVDVAADINANLFAIKADSRTSDFLLTIDKFNAKGTPIGRTGFVNIIRLACWTPPLIGPQIAINRNTVDFGLAFAGDTTLAKVIRIQNVGTETANVSDIAINSGPFLLGDLPVMPGALAPDDFFDVRIAFAPNDTAKTSATMSVISDDLDEPSKMVYLRGLGLDPTPAEAGLLYAVNLTSEGGHLLAISPFDSGSTWIGDATIPNISDIAIDSKGRIWGAAEGRLLLLDAVSGRTYGVVETQLDRIDAFAFDRDDNMFAVEFGTLHTIDPQTGAAKMIGYPGVALAGLTFDPAQGTLWASSQNNSAIYTVNLLSGRQKLVGEMGLSPTVPNIAFTANRDLLGSSVIDNRTLLVSIDQLNAATTPLKTIDAENIVGLTAHAQAQSGRHIGTSALSLDFDTVLADSMSRPRKLRIRNVGTQTATISGLESADGQFIIARLPSFPALLQPSEAIDISLTFLPRDSGTVVSELSIYSDDENEPVLHIGLRGEGLLPTPAFVDVCYGVAENKLIIVDPSTGAGTRTGTSDLSGVRDIAINSKGVIYGVKNGELFLIDAKMGKANFVNRTKLDYLNTIAFDTSDVLYGIAQGGLYRVNPSTGGSTIVAEVGHNFGGLAFDPTDNKLWLSQTGYRKDQDVIYTFNPSTAALEPVGRTGLDGGAASLCFDSRGNLFGADNAMSPAVFATINKLTAAATIIGSSGFKGLKALAARRELQSGARLGISAQRIDAGNVLIDSSSAPHKIVLQSIGTQRLTIAEVSFSDPQFSLTRRLTFPVTLEPGQSDSLTLILSPTDTGISVATLTVLSDDVFQPATLIQLKGAGWKLSQPAPALLYAAVGASQARLVTVDPSNGAATFVTRLQLDNVSNIVFNSAAILFGTSGSDIYFIDPTDGRTLLAYRTGLDRLEALAFDDKDNLFVISKSALYKVALQAKSLILVGPTEPSVEGMSFDASTGKLWISKGGFGVHADKIFTVDPRTAETRLVGRTGMEQATFDLAFDVEGRLYGVTGGDGINKLLSIDRMTARAITIGELGFDEATGLALSPPLFDSVTELEPTTSLPTRFELSPNYPNPFNPETQIRYAIPEDIHVQITIYNIRGQVIRQLVDDFQTRNSHQVLWDGTDQFGRQVASGVYIYRLDAGKFSQVRKMTLLR